MGKWNLFLNTNLLNYIKNHEILRVDLTKEVQELYIKNQKTFQREIKDSE